MGDEANDSGRFLTPAEPPEDRDPPSASPPIARTASSATSPRTPSVSLLPASPDEAMQQSERERTRRAAPIVLVILVVSAVGIPFFDGDPVVQRALLASLGVSAAAALWLRWLADEPARYASGARWLGGVRWVVIAWYLVCSATFVNMIYFGVYSGGVVPMFFAVYFLGTAGGGLPWALFVSGAGVHAVACALIVAGVVEDPGILPATFIPDDQRVLATLLIQSLLAAGFVIARVTRAANLRSLHDLRHASLLAARRKVAVEEAVAELQRAAGRAPGRLSGSRLGSFSLGDVIGRGGMGEIYRATNVHTGEPAAVKVLHHVLADDPVTLERFAREARHAAALDTPHVARVLEVGDGVREEPYLAMEYLDGRDLASELRARQRLGRREVLRLVRHVGRGIDAATAAGIVHRDIKPHNVFCVAGAGGAPLWKLLDFGIARLAGRGDTLTQGGVIGTPAYMAPEQALGRAPTHRADLYALAAVAYRALTGFPPYHGSDPARVMATVVHAMPRRPSSLAELSGEADAFFAIALARDPDDRFATGSEMAAALEGALAGALDPELRARATAVLAERPWGDD